MGMSSYVMDEEEKATAARVRAGLQCPECFGPHIDAMQTRFQARPVGFVCTECGCQFGAKQ